MNYFIAPRSGEKSYQNFQSSIKNGVPLARIERYLSPEGLRLLSEQEIIYAWGNRQGTKSQWERMASGDIVLFYAKKRLIMAGTVYYKRHDPELAQAMWPPDEKGNPWQYTFFLRDLVYINMPLEIFNKAADYDPGFFIQGFIHLKGNHLQKLESEYGSVEKMIELFRDPHSEEMPAETESLYVNIRKEIPLSTGDENDITPTLPAAGASKRTASKKIDHLKKAKTSAINGSKGEEFVVRYEKERLVAAGRPDLADQVRRVSLESDSYGYDIESFDDSGKKRFIEVKSSSAKRKEIVIYVSANEFEVGRSLENYYLYYVEGVNTDNPVITPIKSPFSGSRFTVRTDVYVLSATKA